VIVATAVLFLWLLVALGLMAIAEFRPSQRLSFRELAAVTHMPAILSRFGASDRSGGRPRAGDRPLGHEGSGEGATDAASPAAAEPWRGEEEVEARVYERLYGPHGRRR
jgi:hypothetical protein